MRFGCGDTPRWFLRQYHTLRVTSVISDWPCRGDRAWRVRVIVRRYHLWVRIWYPQQNQYARIIFMVSHPTTCNECIITSITKRIIPLSFFGGKQCKSWRLDVGGAFKKGKWGIFCFSEKRDYSGFRRYSSDWNIYDTWLGGKINDNYRFRNSRTRPLALCTFAAFYGPRYVYL